MSNRKFLRIVYIETIKIQHKLQPLVALLNHFVAAVCERVIFVLQTLRITMEIPPFISGLSIQNFVSKSISFCVKHPQTCVKVPSKHKNSPGSLPAGALSGLHSN